MHSRQSALALSGASGSQVMTRHLSGTLARPAQQVLAHQRATVRL